MGDKTLLFLDFFVVYNVFVFILSSQALVFLVTRTRSLISGSVTQHSLDIFNLRHFNDALDDRETNGCIAITLS